ncbi:MAG: hypothetical protein M3Y37_04910 [Chloroflexota bacterium]|nr:hypothetical protein [Chloroflexota bacterium]
MQLAFSEVDPSLIARERISDLLAQARTWADCDPLRCIYFAHEALLIAQSSDRPDAELDALILLIHGMHTDRRTSDLTPFIARAIDLAETSGDRSQLDSLLELLGRWAVENEQDPVPRQRNRSVELPWLLGAVARLEALRDGVASHADPAVFPDESLPRRRPDLGIHDPHTGLLNARGMTAELVRLEDENQSVALIQVAVTDINLDLIPALAKVIDREIGELGIVARNADLTLTVLLPGMTGMAAMLLAQQLRNAVLRTLGGHPVPVGIGVAVKQYGDSTRDLLRRLVDRRDEALATGGVAVVG